MAQEWWQERDNVVDMTNYGLYALGALFAYFLLARPLLRAVTGRLSPQPPLMPVVPLLENYDLPPAGSAVDVMVDHLKVLAGKEPERVAEVVKQWVQKKHGRTE